MALSSALVELVAAHAPAGNNRRLPLPGEIMPRIHFVQQWLTQSDQPMEEALQDIPRL